MAFFLDKEQKNRKNQGEGSQEEVKKHKVPCAHTPVLFLVSFTKSLTHFAILAPTGNNSHV